MFAGPPCWCDPRHRGAALPAQHPRGPQHGLHRARHPPPLWPWRAFADRWAVCVPPKSCPASRMLPLFDSWRSPAKKHPAGPRIAAMLLIGGDPGRLHVTSRRLVPAGRCWGFKPVATALGAWSRSTVTRGAGLFPPSFAAGAVGCRFQHRPVLLAGLWPAWARAALGGSRKITAGASPTPAAVLAGLVLEPRPGVRAWRLPPVDRGSPPGVRAANQGRYGALFNHQSQADRPAGGPGLGDPSPPRAAVPATAGHGGLPGGRPPTALVVPDRGPAFAVLRPIIVAASSLSSESPPRFLKNPGAPAGPGPPWRRPPPAAARTPGAARKKEFALGDHAGSTRPSRSPVLPASSSSWRGP